LPKLRILELADFRWYNASAHYALTVSQALAKNGHQVYLGLTCDRNLPRFGSTESIPRIVEFPLVVNNSLTWLDAAVSLHRFIKKNRIQIVNVHSAASHLLAAGVKRLGNINFRLVRTRGEAHPPKANLFNKHLYCKLTDQIIVPSEILIRPYTDRLGLPTSKISHVPLGIEELHNFGQVANSNWKDKLGILPDEQVVGIVGRLSPVKGHIYFIQAAKLVLEAMPSVKFIIAGQDAQITQERLKRLAYRLGIIDRFVFLGNVSNVHDLISTFDVGVISSIGSETICRVLLEYLAAGKPVVGTRVNGIPELIEEGNNGYLVPPGNSKELAQALINILKEDKLRMGMGAYSRKLAESKYNLHEFADQTAAIYGKLLSES